MDFYLPPWPVSEDDVRVLAAGHVPDWLRTICRSMVDWSLETGALDYAGRREAQQHRERKGRRG